MRLLVECDMSKETVNMSPQLHSINGEGARMDGHDALLPRVSWGAGRRFWRHPHSHDGWQVRYLAQS